MRQAWLWLLLLWQGAAQAQRPPVVLVNGYDTNWRDGQCKIAASSRETFGLLEDYLKADGVPQVYFFDNCFQSGRQTLPNPPIEELGGRLGAFVNARASQVDVVAHSMGGLIVRSYLSGKQTAFGSFAPPANPKVRKAVFIATPHFGAQLANFFGGPPGDVQAQQLRMGSAFLWDLATWNQGFDDLRGVDALAIIGRGGLSGAGDGVVSLTSASLSSLLRPDERTRIIPYCHTESFFVQLDCVGGLIAGVNSPQHPTGAIVRSFLADSNGWRQTGETPTQSNVLSQEAGIYFGLKDAFDAFQTVDGVDYKRPDAPVHINQLKGGPLFFYENQLLSGAYVYDLRVGTRSFEVTGALRPGVFNVFLVRPPPIISLVLPAAGLPDGLTVAPGSIVSIYGAGLARGTAQATTLPLPTQMLGTSLAFQGQLAQLLFVSDRQINAVLPTGLGGLVRATVVTPSGGQHNLNVLLAPAVPTIFSLGSNGTGPAAALHASSSALITNSTPATVGEYIAVYATGLGATLRSGNLDVAALTPELFIGGVRASVVFAGRAPGFVGLDQVNVQIPQVPSGPAVPLVMRSGGHVSNIVTLAIR